MRRGNLRRTTAGSGGCSQTPEFGVTFRRGPSPRSGSWVLYVMLSTPGVATRLIAWNAVLSGAEST
jgi:hypothetical protein